MLHLSRDGLTTVARGLSLYLISPLIRLRLQSRKVNYALYTCTAYLYNKSCIVVPAIGCWLVCDAKQCSLCIDW